MTISDRYQELKQRLVDKTEELARVQRAIEETKSSMKLELLNCSPKELRNEGNLVCFNYTLSGGYKKSYKLFVLKTPFESRERLTVTMTPYLDGRDPADFYVGGMKDIELLYSIPQRDPFRWSVNPVSECY